MKEHLLLLFIVAITITATGQSTISNGNFEAWSFSTYDYPKNYSYTSNLNAFSRSGIFNVFKTTDANSGTYAVRLTSIERNPGYYLNSDPNSNQNPSEWTGGMPYTETPTGIRGYYKYNVASGDAGLVIVTFRKGGNDIGTYYIPIGGIHATYTLFEYTFSPALTQTPDAVIIGAVSSDITVHGDGVPGSELFLDNISFTGVTNQPALLNGDFELWEQVQTPATPDNWYSMNNWQGVSKSTDSNSGSALELTTYKYTDDSHNEQAQFAQVSNGYWDNTCSCWKGASFTNQNGILAFYYKYAPASVTDNAQISFNFKKANGDIGGYNRLLGASSSYQYVEIPFDLGQIPDVLIVQIQSSNINNLSFFGSVLKIDDLQFKMLQNATWNGSLNNLWSNSANWTPNTVPTSTTNVTIPDVTIDPRVTKVSGSFAVCNNLTIESGAVLTIPSDMALTVNGNLNNQSPHGVVIESAADGTGSLITGSISGSGEATVQRWLKAGKWNMVSSPLAGQMVSDFLSANGNIPQKTDPVLGEVRAMMNYNSELNSWNSFFKNTTDYGSLNRGRGFSMRIGSADAAVTFTGSLQSGNFQTPMWSSPSEGSWNCIGNPYTSAIGMTMNSGSGTNNFLSLNSANLDPVSGIYVWESADVANGGSGIYTAYSNAVGPLDMQQGQAFFVKSNPGAGSVNFSPMMQFHNSGLTLKSNNLPWPTIKFKARVNSQISSTSIAFNSNMTKGLDPTYDAALFKGGSDLVVYSRLVEDNGIPFAIQALPDNNYSSMIIPIGIDYTTGGKVVFSAELLNMPADCIVILEDKLTKTFTDLSKEVYSVTISSGSVIADRFQLHTSDLISSVNKEILSGSLNAYATSSEIRIVGQVGNSAVATLYDIQGKIVLTKNLDQGSLDVIPIPIIQNGVYMLFVKDGSRSQGFKILVRQ